MIIILARRARASKSINKPINDYALQARLSKSPDLKTICSYR